MKICKKCGNEKPLFEFTLRKESGRYRNDCKVCGAAACRKRYRSKPKEYSEKNKAYRELKAAEIKEQRLQFRNANREQLRERQRKFYAANKATYVGYALRRRLVEQQATPAWANQEAIKWFYENAGPGLEVDHVVPLRHPQVCGLHVEHNLRIITFEANRKKNNHFS